MIIKELLDALTKYYAIIVKDESGGRWYEDQTAVPSGMTSRTVDACDFYEDDGDGEKLLIYVKPRK